MNIQELPVRTGRFPTDFPPPNEAWGHQPPPEDYYNENYLPNTAEPHHNNNIIGTAPPPCGSGSSHGQSPPYSTTYYDYPPPPNAHHHHLQGVVVTGTGSPPHHPHHVQQAYPQHHPSPPPLGSFQKREGLDHKENAFAPTLNNNNYDYDAKSSTSNSHSPWNYPHHQHHHSSLHHSSTSPPTRSHNDPSSSPHSHSPSSVLTSTPTTLGSSTTGGEGHSGSSVSISNENNPLSKPGRPSFKRRTTANKKERRRTQSINNAFTELRDCIPNVPADTKLSKIKTLRLATSYIAYLAEVLSGDDPLRTPQAFTAEISKRMGRGDEKRRKELLMQELAEGGMKREERKAKGRTGWPQHVWALELQQ